MTGTLCDGAKPDHEFPEFAAQLLLGSIALAPGTLAFFRLDVDLASIAVAF